MIYHKMFSCLLFACILCSTSCFEYKAPEKKCNVEDFKCVGEIVKTMIKLISNGDKDLGVEAIDPLHHALLENHLEDFRYTLTDSVVIGFKDVVLNFLTIVKKTSIHFDYTVPYYEMYGNYKISGKLLNVELEDDGKYYLNATNIHLVVDVQKEFFVKDGHTHLKLTNIKANMEQLGTTYFVLQTSSGEQKKIPAELQKIINENPKAVTQLWQIDISAANVNKIFNQFNKILEHIPLTDLVYGEVDN